MILGRTTKHENDLMETEMLLEKGKSIHVAVIQPGSCSLGFGKVAVWVSDRLCLLT